MQEEILDEYSLFLEDVQNQKFELGKYLDADCYEDEYSHDDINEAMGILENKIIEYLKINCPDRFLVFSSYDYCVFVCTIEKARKLRWSENKIRENLVSIE